MYNSISLLLYLLYYCYPLVLRLPISTTMQFQQHFDEKLSSNHPKVYSAEGKYWQSPPSNLTILTAHVSLTWASWFVPLKLHVPDKTNLRFFHSAPQSKHAVYAFKTLVVMWCSASVGSVQQFYRKRILQGSTVRQWLARWWNWPNFLKYTQFCKLGALCLKRKPIHQHTNNNEKPPLNLLASP